VPPAASRAAASASSPALASSAAGPAVDDPQRLAQPDRHRRSLLSARRWRLIGLLAAILLTAAVVVLVLARSGREGDRSGNPAGAASGQGLGAEQAARSQAVAWVTQQVSRDSIVACDRVMCSSLAARGFPVGNLLVLGPSSPDPLGAAVVIATADVRSQIGARLSARYAPLVIASFDSGGARIDIRAIAPDGAALYQAALSADLRAREKSGAQLLGNKQIDATATARAQLAAGQVDSRLLIAVIFMAGHHPVRIADFSGLAPGVRAGAGNPLRFMDVAQPAGATSNAWLAYVQSVRALLGAQLPTYHPLRIELTRLPAGQAVLRIEYGAPSPLGLLHAGAP
jgi:hypothetical protein